MIPDIIMPNQLSCQKPKQKQLGKTKNDLKIRARKIVKAMSEGKTESQALESVGY